MHNKVENIDNNLKVEDIHKYLVRSRRSATLLPSDTAIRQEIPLKPEVFYGRDNFVQDITRLLVLGSPVQSGLWAFFGKTETETGPYILKSLKKPDRTDGNRFSAVFCSFLQFQDRSEPVVVQTSS